MGKRKLHDTAFFQCDWTGFPMKTAHCYMPTWSPGGKLVKKGSYCNWESVVAHAAHQLRLQELTPEVHTKILEHVEYITGTHVDAAPHYTELMHTKGRMDTVAFHKICARQAGPITGVKVQPNGEVIEVILKPDDEGIFDFKAYLHAPFLNGSLSTFHSMRKKGSNKGTDRDLSVWYYATKDLPHNAAASNMFKMQLYGDVLLVQQSREAAFLPRDRYVSFRKGQFDNQFCKRKRSKHTEPTAMSTEAYGELKRSMQATLNSYEQRVSASAITPREHSKGMMMAPTDGKKLAKAMRERQEASRATAAAGLP